MHMKRKDKLPAVVSEEKLAHFFKQQGPNLVVAFLAKVDEVGGPVPGVCGDALVAIRLNVEKSHATAFRLGKCAYAGINVEAVLRVEGPPGLGNGYCHGKGGSGWVGLRSVERNAVQFDEIVQDALDRLAVS